MSLNLQSIEILSGRERPAVIAGPCSAENREQVLETARRLKDEGVSILRAGLWKPRTKPGCFEGVGQEGMSWLLEARDRYGLFLATEVATEEHVRSCVKEGIDLLWIGARSASSPFVMQEIANALKGHNVPVLVKNPISPDLELWIGALERLNRAGITQIGAIHRGFASLSDGTLRNPPHWSVPIELKRRYPALTVFCDPSHMGGKRDLIAPLSQEAMDLGMDGLMVECHADPDHAWSDAQQQITPEALGGILKGLILRSSNEPSEFLEMLRKDIDAIDRQLIDLLSRRMSTARQIGRIKKAGNMPVMQSARYQQLISRALDEARMGRLDERFMQKLFTVIHEESVRQQLDILSHDEGEQY